MKLHSILNRAVIISLVSLLAIAEASAGAKLKLTEKGLQIDVNALGSPVLEAPGLLIEGSSSREKPAVELEGGVLSARYPSGARLQIKIQDSESATISFSDLPPKAKSFVFSMLLPIRLNMGGQFVLGTKAAVAFPETKDKQIVSDGWAQSCTIVDSTGSGVRLTLPGAYQQLQDNRAFNWNIFSYLYYFKFAEQKGKTEFSIKAEEVTGFPTARAATPSAAATANQPAFLIDRYGQRDKKDYPGKIKSDDELKADAVKEEKELAAYKPNPLFDIYGGLAGSGQRYKLKKTGFFHVEQVEGRWALVTPEGNSFFQLGVCGIARVDDFTKVAGREKIYEWLPDKKDTTFQTAWRENRPDWGIFSFYSANWIRKFGRPFSDEEWTGQVVKRLRGWGFNSAGAFSTNTGSMRAANFPGVSMLPLGKGPDLTMLPDKFGAASVVDPFAPGVEAALDARFAKSLPPRASDPLLIGYFYSNEPHYEDLPKTLPSYRASKVAAKARLVKTLEEKYGTIEKFNAAWKPVNPYPDFNALKEEPLFIRTAEAAADMDAFYRYYLETYYSMLERLYRKYDPNHLLIGSRLTPGTSNNETAVRVTGKYTDVVSVNYYTYSIESSFLKRVSDWSGDKPIILSEWYYSAPDTGLVGAKVRNQEERAKAYRNYVEQAAALPFVVGSQWFIYGDQSVTGRFFEGFNGEGNNTGLVDVGDRVYESLVTAARETNSHIYDVMLGKQKPFVFDDPRFSGQAKGVAVREVSAPRALPEMKMNGSTANWPGRPAEPIEPSRLAMGNPNEKLRGDFRLCWDDKNLYFLIQVKDPTPGFNTRSGDRLWNGDGVELFIGQNLQAPGSLRFDDRQVLLGAGKEAKIHIIDHPEDSVQCPVVLVPEVGGDGYTLAVTLPWSVLGIEPKSGKELLFDVAIDNSDDGEARHQQLIWNGNAGSSKNRETWGRIRLIDN